MSKIVVDSADLPGIIRETIRRSLLDRASAQAPKGLTIAGTSRGPELWALSPGQLELELFALARDVACRIYEHAVPCDFDSASAEDDPSLFVVELRGAWQQLKR